MSEPVDLDEVRRLLAELRDTVVAHPEVAQRTAQALAGELDSIEDEGTDMDTKLVRLPVELWDRCVEIAELVKGHAKGAEVMGWQRISPTAVARVALARGLEAMAADLASTSQGHDDTDPHEGS